jgi:hypothetical protein
VSFEAVATNDQFIKAKPKSMHGFMRALLKIPRGTTALIVRKFPYSIIYEVHGDDAVDPRSQ